MSLLSLFSKSAPTLAGIQFDAVLEDTLETEVQNTGFTIESGVRAADHRIILPFRWSLIVAVSDNPIKPMFTDFIGGALSNLTDNALVSTVAGLSASALAGSEEARSSNVLNALIELQTSGTAFDIDAGDIQLSNMVINRIRRRKTPDNEGGLIAEVELQELPTLSTVVSANSQPAQNQLQDEDPSKSQIGALVDKGEQLVSDVGDSINSAVSSVVSSVTGAIDDAVGAVAGGL